MAGHDPNKPGLSYDSLDQLVSSAALAAKDVLIALAAQPPAAPVETESEIELVCAEAYQVVGSMLSDLGQFDTDRGQKILDNLSQAKMVHSDVLPWPSFERPHNGLSAATEQATGRYEFPYNRTFQAIAAATSVYAEGVGVNVSVKAFQEAFNSFPDARPLNEPQTAVTIDDVPSCGQENDYRRARNAGDEVVNFNGRLVTWADIEIAVRGRNAALALSRPEPK